MTRKARGATVWRNWKVAFRTNDRRGPVRASQENEEHDEHSREDEGLHRATANLFRSAAAALSCGF